MRRKWKYERKESNVKIVNRRSKNKKELRNCKMWMIIM
jgi:hypothetical protein